MKNKNNEKCITVSEAEEQVVVMAKRLALLYHFMSEVLVEKYGSIKGKKIIREIIWRYGCNSGLKVKEMVEELGLPLTVENFKKASDLPKLGWRFDSLMCEDGVKRDCVTYCPLADTWKEKGSMELGRLYCLVDQAKYVSYNDIICNHLTNILDGDDCCLFDLKEKND